jgi:hypothetical protein
VDEIMAILYVNFCRKGDKDKVLNWYRYRCLYDSNVFKICSKFYEKYKTK